MREYFNAPRTRKEVGRKSDNTLVTIADTKINELVIAKVTEQYPDHGILGEEASKHSDRPDLWVCDPIDGTNGFVTGEPTSMFSLAYVRDGTTIVAVTYDPFLDRLFTASKQGGTYCNGQKLQVSTLPIEEATIAGPGGLKELERGLALYQDVRHSGATVRLFGGMVYKGCLVAEGKIEGRMFSGLGAHDIAAVKLIVEEAGGKVTDLDGNEQRYDRPIRGAIISNGIIHDDLLRSVRAFGVENLLGF
jgi:fructose-1,6-bisphosphatase/inositol monophosphatase family enzyme